MHGTSGVNDNGEQRLLPIEAYIGSRVIPTKNDHCINKNNYVSVHADVSVLLKVAPIC